MTCLNSSRSLSSWERTWASIYVTYPYYLVHSMLEGWEMNVTLPLRNLFLFCIGRGKFFMSRVVWNARPAIKNLLLRISSPQSPRSPYRRSPRAEPERTSPGRPAIWILVGLWPSRSRERWAHLINRRLQRDRTSPRSPEVNNTNWDNRLLFTTINVSVRSRTSATRMER